MEAKKFIEALNSKEIGIGSHLYITNKSGSYYREIKIYDMFYDSLHKTSVYKIYDCCTNDMFLVNNSDAFDWVVLMNIESDASSKMICS